MIKKIVNMWRQHEQRIEMENLLRFTADGAHEDVLAIAKGNQLA